MKKARLKFIIFLVIVTVTLPLTVLMLILLIQFIASFQEGADPASIFRGNELIIPPEDEARWLSYTDVEVRKPSQGQADEIIAAYWEAWEAYRRAYATGDRSDLLTYWAGEAYHFVYNAIDPEVSVELSHTSHILTLNFYSDDRSVVHLNDTFILTYHQSDVTMKVSAEAIMTLDEGFWRVRLISLKFS